MKFNDLEDITEEDLERRRIDEEAREALKKRFLETDAWKKHAEQHQEAEIQRVEVRRKSEKKLPSARCNCGKEVETNEMDPSSYKTLIEDKPGDYTPGSSEDADYVTTKSNVDY